MRSTSAAAILFCIAVSLCGASGSVSIRILNYSAVYVHPSADPYDRNNQFGFNHAPSIVRLSDGRLFSAWFSGPYEASVHQVILAAASPDGGGTWGPAFVLQDIPRQSDFDPAFISDNSRCWFFFSAGRHNRYPFVQDQKNQVGPDSFNTYFRTTDNAGQNWAAPVLAHEKVFCRSNGIRLTRGELLLPIYKVPSEGGVLKSVDEGKTWQLRAGIKTPAGAGEPTIAELNSGKVLMLLRTNDGQLWRTFSSDRGDSWESPQATDLTAAASSHFLLRLRNGSLALIHNPSKPPYRTPLTVRVSRDDGLSWSAPVELARVDIPRAGEGVWSRQVCYPSAVELPDGTVVAVWAEIKVSDLEQFGDILCARIRID